MDGNWYEEMIPAYLAGTLSDSDREAFEKELAENPELHELVADTRFMRAGINILESIDKGHPAAEILITYAESPASLDDSARGEIETHLRSCSECRQDVDMARESLGLTAATSMVDERGLLTRLHEWLSARVPSPGPTLAAAVTAMLVIAVFIGYQLPGPSEMDVAVVEITDSVERGAETATVITIDADVPVVHFRFMLPTIEGATYSIDLIDDAGKTVLSLPNQEHALPMEIMVPSAYLHEGLYRVQVVEQIGPGADRDPEEYDLTVRIEFSE